MSQDQNTEMQNWVLRMAVEPGWFEVSGNCYFVTHARFLDKDPGPGHGDCALMNETREQLERYFAGQCGAFSLPVMTRGTEFQQRVWTALESIPAGQAITYGELARRVGSSARAVGGACRHNPVALIVPCHRVVSSQGIGGYAGDVDGPSINVKHWLLQHEV